MDNGTRSESKPNWNYPSDQCALTVSWTEGSFTLSNGFSQHPSSSSHYHRYRSTGTFKIFPLVKDLTDSNESGYLNYLDNFFSFQSLKILKI